MWPVGGGDCTQGVGASTLDVGISNNTIEIEQ